MKNTIRGVLEHFLSHYEDNRDLLHLMHKDGVDEEGEIQPGRIPSLNAAYYLDGGTSRRSHFQKRFDRDLTRGEKELLGAEVIDLGELANMVYHPSFVLEVAPSKTVSRDRDVARERLLEILYNDPENLVQRGKEEVLLPIFDLFRDELFDEEKAVSALLPHIMTRQSEHEPEKYKKVFLSQFLIPAAQGKALGHWDEMLSKLSREKIQESRE